MTSNMSVFNSFLIHFRIALCIGVARTNQTSGMERFAKIVHSFKPLTVFAERSVLDVWLVLALCCYATVMCFVFGALHFILNFLFQ